MNNIANDDNFTLSSIDSLLSLNVSETTTAATTPTIMMMMMMMVTETINNVDDNLTDSVNYNNDQYHYHYSIQQQQHQQLQQHQHQQMPEEETEELYMSSKIVVIIYSILFVISAIGNTTVFISLIRTRRLRKKSRINLMILNLTIADLIVTYIMIPMEICWRITNEWLAGDFVCRIMQTFRAFGPYLSSMILVCISIDRYFAVLYPMQVNDAHRRSKIMLLFAWLTSIVCSVPQTIVFHTESHPHFPDFVQCVSYNSLTEQQEVVYSTFGIAVLYLIPLIIIIFCYTRIIWKIYKRSIQSSKDNRNDKIFNKKSKTRKHSYNINNNDDDCGRKYSDYSNQDEILINHNDDLSRNNDLNHNDNDKHRLHLRRSDMTQIEKSRIRTLRMTIIIVMAFVWCWTPYASIVLLYHFYKPQVENMPKDLKDALFMFAVSNSCVNPLVYGSYTMNIRQYFRQFFKNFRFWKRRSPTGRTTIKSASCYGSSKKSLTNRAIILNDEPTILSQLN